VRTGRTIDPIADPAWLGFLERCPGAEVFHHPLWLELLRARYGYGIYACCVVDGDRILAGIPIARVESRLTGRRLVSLPFSDLCSPVVAEGTDEALALAALADGLVEERNRTGLELTIHAELRGIPGAHVQQGFFRHLLPLVADPSEVERGFSKSQVKRGIKKARREGLVTERRTDTAALDAFYALHVPTRKKLGVPTQPKRFIRSFADLFDAGLGFVELVKDRDQPIAAAVFLTYNGVVTYKYGASDVRALGKRPNNLLFSEVIRQACGEGFHTLDFGRTDMENEGLRAFKRSWGASEVELPYTYLTDEPPSTDTPLRNRIMTATIQRSPAGVSRLVGETLYRHFG
jgi:CelD/BcsL family acetyltransferase involved in cellulose biosynthesis